MSFKSKSRKKTHWETVSFPLKAPVQLKNANLANRGVTSGRKCWGQERPVQPENSLWVWSGTTTVASKITVLSVTTFPPFAWVKPTSPSPYKGAHESCLPNPRVPPRIFEMELDEKVHFPLWLLNWEVQVAGETKYFFSSQCNFFNWSIVDKRHRKNSQ